MTSNYDNTANTNVRQHASKVILEQVDGHKTLLGGRASSERTDSYAVDGRGVGVGVEGLDHPQLAVRAVHAEILQRLRILLLYFIR